MDTFSLYNEFPLFSGDLLVGWNPLADELPALVQDELQPNEDVHMYPASAPHAPLVKGTLIEEPKQVDEPNLQSVYLDTSVNLLDLLKPEGSSHSPVSPQIMEMDISKELQKQTSVEDMLQNVSEMLIANLAPLQFVSESSSANQNIDLSSLHNLSGETGMLNDEEVNSILNGSEDPVDKLLNNSSNGLHADILSPVSPEDIDYILSSTPTSPISINASSPCSNNSIYSSYPTSPYSLDTSLETEPSVLETSDAPVTISMKYLREELLKPSPCSMEENKKEIPKRVSGRQKSQRQRVKYEPYSPSPVDRSLDIPNSKASSKSNDHRFERKKQQNKDAALRYRQKKRDEKGTVKDECDHLEKKNTELKDKVDSMTREIQYLKDLLSEVYKAKATSDKKRSK